MGGECLPEERFKKARGRGVLVDVVMNEPEKQSKPFFFSFPSPLSSSSFSSASFFFFFLSFLFLLHYSCSLCLFDDRGS